MTDSIEILHADDGSPTGYSLPAIDLNRFTHGSDDDRTRIAAQFDGGLREIGFAVVQNHGVAPDLFERMLAVTRDFFTSDESEKLAVASRPSEGRFCGWVSFAADAASRVYGADEDSPPDLRERYRAVLTSHEEVLERVGKNQWPSHVPAMGDVWVQYADVFSNVAMRVMSVCEKALDLEPGFFTPYFERHFSVLMSTYSPPIENPPEGHDRCGAHTDTGTFTFVFQPGPKGGIQVQLPSGRWGVPQTKKGDIIVNCADLMAVWTNDRWKSTVHRVGGPREALQQERQSVVFFHQPALDVEVACLESCRSPELPAKYEAITLRRHFDMNQKQLGTREEVERATT